MIKPDALCGLCPDVQECMECHIVMNGVDGDVPVICFKESPDEYLRLKKAISQKVSVDTYWGKQV